MSPALRCVAALAMAMPLAYLSSILAIRVASKTGFLDRPYGYKGHRAATPYLGGGAVMFAFLLVAVTMSGAVTRLAALLGCAAGMALVGTLDDRWPAAPRWRILAELAAAVILWSSHLGFTAFASDSLNLVFTVLWVIGLVNAFNLCDNMDGSCTTLVAVSAAGIAAFALVLGDTGVAAIALALAGACIGFLPHNLAGPARIFLGDGGSMPLGFLIAGLTLAVSRGHNLGGTELIAGGLLAGLPILDTTLVVVSRTRRGLSVATPGRDHLSHRLLRRLQSPRRVAIALALLQGVLVTLAVTGQEGGGRLLEGFGFAAVIVGLVAIAMLESPPWHSSLEHTAAAAKRGKSRAVRANE